ncbi:hypothetical protein GCM10007898_34260 [Dyella flagellata]|uniref:Uncharacterized protein n=1 Tax=Dyella flagellata TaxID=1867833 RepID=A0ABQ5XF57_9GAMM|nr:hypothetical protein GCM10007898_34260 [Dyella flagellata]
MSLCFDGIFSHVGAAAKELKQQAYDRGLLFAARPMGGRMYELRVIVGRFPGNAKPCGHERVSCAGTPKRRHCTGWADVLPPGSGSW